MINPKSDGIAALSAILVDDENHSIHTLEYELNRHCPQISVLDTCQSGSEAIHSVRRHKPDLLFLDIEMPAMNGFQVLEKLMPIDFDIIFVTAYDQYAIRAFRFAAIDYLLKPVISTNLIEAVERVLQKKERKTQDLQLQTLLYNVQSKNQHSPRITLPNGNALEYISVCDIVRCLAESNYCHIYMKDSSKYFIAKTLREVEEWLTPFRFFRCHQSHLINLSEVKRFIKSDGGYLVMSDSSEVPVSRRRINQFMDVMKE